MLKVDIEQVNRYGDTFFSSTDTAYIVFMVIGIVGYFTVPSVANYIVHAGGGANYLMYKASNLFTGGTRSAASAVVGGASGAAASSYQTIRESYGNLADSSQTSGSKNDSFMRDKLSGKS
jgi:hypothetical protein